VLVQERIVARRLVVEMKAVAGGADLVNAKPAAAGLATARA
jgi:hypothetical protein